MVMAVCPPANNKLEAALALASICKPQEPLSLQQTRMCGFPMDREKTKSVPRTKFSFPMILMDIISDPVNSDLISWLPQGFAFIIKDSKKFNREISPFMKLDKKKIESELRRWGFKLISRGSKNSVYFHEYFHRDDPSLCRRMSFNSNSRNNALSEAIEIHEQKIRESEKGQPKFLPRNSCSPTQSPVIPLEDRIPEEQICEQTSPWDLVRVVSTSSEGDNYMLPKQIVPQQPSHWVSDYDRLNEQKNLILSNMYLRRQANDDTHNRLARQFMPGSKLAEMNNSLHSFREVHNIIISSSINALFENRVNANK